MKPCGQPKCSSCSQTYCLINRFCSAQWKSRLEDEKTSCTYKTGQNIFHEDNMVFGLHFIYDGKIKVFNTGNKEKQHIVRLAGSGEMLGFRAFADKVYRVSAAALEDTVLCFITKQVFLEILQANPKLPLHLLDVYAKELTKLETRYRNFAQLTITERIADALLLIGKKWGKTVSNGILLDINILPANIARLTGAATEDVYRTMGKFRKLKLIKKTNNNITITEPKKLLEIVLQK